MNTGATGGSEIELSGRERPHERGNSMSELRAVCVDPLTEAGVTGGPRHRVRLLVGLISALLVTACVVAGQARAAVITNYTNSSIVAPYGIVAGPDGALWFTNQYSNSIGRITTGGAVTNFTGTGISSPEDITMAVGPDGALWFTNDYGTYSIERMTTSGAVTNYTDPSINYPQGIVAGPDGAMWFTNYGNNSIGRISTSGVVTNYTGPGIGDPNQIVAGPDGALWFTNTANNSIGRITTSGVVTNYTDPSIDGPEGIAVGPDGALWFTNYFGNSIGRISTSGVVTNYTDPSINGPARIAVGPDGALWFTNYTGNSIGSISTSGVVTNYTDPSISGPEGITAGPDGALWFTNFTGNSIGRIQPSVSETPTQLCQLTVSYVESSAKYQALPTSARNAINQSLTAACNQLATITPKLNAKQVQLAIALYKGAVTVLAKGGWLTSSQANNLTTLAGELTLT